MGGAFLVRRKGLEPLTYWFVASHSIQLSYRRIPRICNALKYNSTSICKMQVFFYFFLKNFFLQENRKYGIYKY